MVSLLLKALADDVRRQILLLLSKGELTTSEIIKHFDCSRQAINKHLLVLEYCELIKSREKGREKVYVLQSGKLKPLKKWIKDLGDQAKEFSNIKSRKL